MHHFICLTGLFCLCKGPKFELHLQYCYLQLFDRKEKQDAFRFCYKFDCSSLQFSLLAPQSLYSVDEFGFDMLLPLMEAEVASFN